jgi:hypothetical protein
MIRPLSATCRAAFCSVKNAPFVLTPNNLSKSASDTVHHTPVYQFDSGIRETTMSRRPKCSTVVANRVERAPHAKHGRVIEARLTKRGRAKVQDAHRTVFEIEERMLSEITPAGRRRLNETLRRLVENLGTS